MKRTAFGLIAVAATGFVIAGCGSGDDASREDAHDVPGHLIDKRRPEVHAFNNHYPNIEEKCDGHGHRIFVQTHDSATGRNMVILPDPTCPGYVKGQEPAVVVNGG